MPARRDGSGKAIVRVVASGIGKMQLTFAAVPEQLE
jgi:hypothetical protein